jgi:hypothetical protein
LSATPATGIAAVSRRVGRNQGAHHGIGSCQCPAYRLIVAVELGLIVGQDDNGATRIPAAFAPDVIGGVEHATGNIGPTVESLLPKQPVKSALHLLAAIVKRQADAGVSIEDHDPHAVVFAEYRQSLAGRIGDALHMRPHTGADIQQKEYIYRHVFARKISDRHLFAILTEDKILDIQVGDGPVAGVDHLGVHANQGYITAENDVVVARHGQEGSTRKGEREKLNGTKHGYPGRPKMPYYWIVKRTTRHPRYKESQGAPRVIIIS